MPGYDADSASTSPIAIHVVTRDDEMTPEVRQLARKAAATRFRRFAERIHKIVISCRDLNGPKGGIDKHVTVAVHSRDGATRHVSGRATSYEAALIGVMQRAKHVVLRSPQLGSRRPRRVGAWQSPT